MKRLRKIIVSVILTTIIVNSPQVFAYNDWPQRFPDYKLMATMESVPADKNFTIRFSSDIDRSNFENGNIELINGETNGSVPINISIVDNKVIKVKPQNNLKGGTRYYLYVHKNFTNNYGKELDNGIVTVINVSKGAYEPEPTVPVTGEMQEFIDSVKTGADNTYEKYNLYQSVTLAQAILETGWGKSELATEANNLFGIKADKNWTGEIYVIESKEWDETTQSYIVKKSNFKKYKTREDGVQGRAEHLKNNSRYSEAGVFVARNYYEQISALKTAGYATDPDYVKKICKIIEKYELWKYDENGKIIPY